ncbi:hypothetical protein CYMTET_11854 [Cymbomonas tetramitiformis]|uniref:Uncharacterized protein n=1 Tax=Cymbomonas tetramitiformis TaxID=36881 RepID=A0AAE0GLR8_9CHLO|nr:hypothetical protein CYMTET_11854 [Cymbomonas tetramitiformis]
MGFMATAVMEVLMLEYVALAGVEGTAVAGCMLDSTNGVDTVHLQVMTMVTSIAVKVAATAIAVMRAVWKVMDVPMRGDTMNVPTGLLASLFVIP